MLVHLALLVLFPLSALARIQAVSGIHSATGTIVRSARELGAAEQSGVLDHPAPFGPVTFAAVAAALAWLAWRGSSKD